MRDRLEATEMWFYRRMLRISWTERVSNTDVLRRMGVERLLMRTIKERQCRFIGHLLRETEGVERHILENEADGRRARGRQRTKMLDWMRKEMGVRSNIELQEKAMDRGAWRRLCKISSTA